MRSVALRAVTALLSIAFSSTAVAQTSGPNYTSAVRYDALNRTTGTISPDADGAAPFSYLATRTTYDDDNHTVIVETGALSSWQPETVAPSAWTGFTPFTKVETSLDLLDRKVAESSWGWDASLSTPTWVRKSLTQYSYDPVGRPECTAVRMDPATWAAPLPSACTLLTSGTAANPDRITKNRYDDAGQLEKVVKAFGTPLQQDYVTYTYSNNGKPLTVKDANGNVAGYAYDAYDRLATWSFPSKTATGSVSATDYEAYTYDLNGNRESLRKRDGRTFTYNYDALNRVTAKIVPDACEPGYACTTPPWNATRDVYYGYTVRGEQLYARFNGPTGTDTVDTVWDGFGRQSSQTVAMGGVSRTVNVGYDLEGNRKRLNFPDATFFMYNYDQLARLYLVRLGNTTSIATMAYDAQGRQTSETRNNVTTTFGYDLVSRLASLADDLPGTAGDIATTYGYNYAGQLASRERNNPAPYAWSGYVDVSRAYTVNGLNQYTGAASATGSATFGYDANGNLVSDGTRGFTYDAENRLVQTAAGAELTYDALGRLYKVATSTTSETYLYEGDQRIAEYDGSGTMTARYVPGSGGDNPLFWYDGSATTNPRALQGDERGSIVSVVDGSGTILGYNSYDEYGIPGNVRDTNGRIAAFTNIGRYQYTGQLWVPQLNLYYYKARFYSPFLGRFMQTDPIGYADQNNLYAYVGNDPMDRTDPTGLCTGSLFSNAGGECTSGSGVGPRPAQVIPDGSITQQTKPKGSGTAVGSGAGNAGATGSTQKPIYNPCGAYVRSVGCVKTEETHYDRNKSNYPPRTLQEAKRRQWLPVGDAQNRYHRNGPNGAGNVKYLSPDGHQEGVYDRRGRLVTSQENMGTYNYISPNVLLGIPHFFVDVVPYYIYGNSPNDTTNVKNRVIGN